MLAVGREGICGGVLGQLGILKDQGERDGELNKNEGINLAIWGLLWEGRAFAAVSWGN